MCNVRLEYELAITMFYLFQAVVVHVCEATLFKRLIEFENTDSGSLTVCM